MTEVFGFPRDGHTYSADEVGRALAGIFQREADGTPRVGIVGEPPTAVPISASWQLEVGVFSYVHQVVGSVQLSGLSDAEQVAITPAAGSIPVGEARIDRVVWNPVAAELSVIEGTPAVSPVKPSADGFAPLFTVRVNAGDGMIIAGQVEPDFQTTALAGSGDLPAAIAVGVIAESHISGMSTIITPVTFPVGMFDAPPVVIATPIATAAAGIDVSVSDVTAEGCNIRRSVDGTRPGGYPVGASWQAVSR